MQDKIDVENKKWVFDKDVSECFDDMLSRSIPQYNLMRDLTYSLGAKYCKIGTNVLDIGCSNGRAIEPFVKNFGEDLNYYLFDVSEPMFEKAKDLLGSVNIENRDITKGFCVANCSLVLSILTIQFTPIEYRQKIIKSIYNSLIDGGAFIFVEKVLGNAYEIDEQFVEQYYNIKRENQYTENQIRDKRKSLEGVLVPITAKWNEDLLKSTGFEIVDCFWRCLNFAGWIAIKKRSD